MSVRVSFLTAALLLAHAALPLQAQTTPVGTWMSMGDGGRPNALIEIREVNGEFVGNIKALYSASDSAAVCDQCDGARRGQRILGMQIVWGMHAERDGWGGGSILDPESGRVYRATMRLQDGGKRLVVRGYVGFSMFGRSEVWVRADENGSAAPASGAGAPSAGGTRLRDVQPRS